MIGKPSGLLNPQWFFLGSCVFKKYAVYKVKLNMMDNHVQFIDGSKFTKLKYLLLKDV